MTPPRSVRLRYIICLFSSPDNWIILGNQGTRWWVADGVYTDLQTTSQAAREITRRPELSDMFDRDWWGVGAWELPIGASYSRAGFEALRRLDALVRVVQAQYGDDAVPSGPEPPPSPALVYNPAWLPERKGKP